MMGWIKLLLLPIAAFLLGSIPWGLILTRPFTTVDVTREGSGNIGATNVKRTSGWILGILTLLGDIAKGAIPVYLGQGLFQTAGFWGETYIALIALLAVLGHLFPLYTRFRGGGKGVATAAGCFLSISPVSFIILLMVFVMMLCFFSRISMASLSAILAAPAVLWEATSSPAFTTLAILLVFLITIRHKDNIRRLIKGVEPPFF